MKIIIDTNIIISALIKNSLTRKLIIDYDGFFYTPELLLEEVLKHQKDILKKSNMSQKEHSELLEFLLDKIKVIPSKNFKSYLLQASVLAQKTDPDDLQFFACALLYPESVIWSNEIRLKKQSQIRIMNTLEFMKEI